MRTLNINPTEMQTTVDTYTLNTATSIINIFINIFWPSFFATNYKRFTFTPPVTNILPMYILQKQKTE